MHPCRRHLPSKQTTRSGVACHRRHRPLCAILGHRVAIVLLAANIDGLVVRSDFLGDEELDTCPMKPCEPHSSPAERLMGSAFDVP